MGFDRVPQQRRGLKESLLSVVGLVAFVNVLISLKNVEDVVKLTRQHYS